MSLMGNTKTLRVYKNDHTCKDSSLQLILVYGTVFQLVRDLPMPHMGWGGANRLETGDQPPRKPEAEAKTPGGKSLNTRST